MAGQPQTKARGRPRTFIQPLLIAGILIAAVLSGPVSAYPSNVHASVFAWSGAHPGQPVPVIVQATGDPARVSSEISRAGGVVGRQFDIISAVEATLPPGSIPAVAANPEVAWIGLDSPVESTGTVKVDLKALSTSYPISVNANDPWSKSYTGAGIGVAIVDTGITQLADFGPGRLTAAVAINSSATGSADGYGHGTHIAGIVGGYKPKGKYVGVAPEANLIGVKISDDTGASSVGDAIAGLQWVYENRANYNIRVVNLSLHSTTVESYRTSALDAAVESLWFNGIFVVVAAGNLGSAPDAVSYPPANDPFVMTVGAIDDRGTTAYGDDVPVPWSSAGATQDGFAKPELLTPGRDIVSTIGRDSLLYTQHPESIVDRDYFRLSGTSMAAGVMSGVAALVLERHPAWKPGELKCTLIATSRQLSAPNSSLRVPRAGIASNQSTPSCNSDTGLIPSAGFGPTMKAGVIAWAFDQADPAGTAAAVGLDITAVPMLPGSTAMTLDAIKWDAIKWDAIKWDAIKWDAIKWDAIKWDAIKWDTVDWSRVSADGVDWTAIKWDAIKWDAIKWDAVKWSAIKWDSVNFDAIKWSAIKWSFSEGN